MSETKKGGAFLNNLLRKSSEIRADRAEYMNQSLDTNYKHYIEGLRIKLTELKMQRTALFDLSPREKGSLDPAVNFKAEEIRIKDMEIALMIREIRVELEEAEARYADLFAPEAATAEA